MTIRRLYGSDENVGGGTWELFLLENPTDDERTRWWMALDALFPPAMPEGRVEYESEGSES